MKNFIYILLFTCLSIPLPGQVKNTSGNQQLLRIGIPHTYLLDVKEQDASAALKIWADFYKRKLQEKSNIGIHMTFTLYDDPKEFEEDLIKNKIDLISIPIEDYYRLGGMDLFDPVITGNPTSEKYTQFVLLAHVDSKLETIKDIEGSNIIMPMTSVSELMRTWIEVELFKNQLQSFDKFFKTITKADKENMAIYSVFFNKRDCALVRKSTFDIANELNPQISSNLKIISISPKYISNVTAIRKDYDPQMSKLIIDLSIQFHKTPEDRQVLNLFKIKQLHNLNGEELMGVKELFAEYKNYTMLTLDKK